MNLENTRRDVRVLEALRSARQIAYETSREDGAHQPWFEQAQDLYERFARSIGVEPEPVFDEEAYLAAKREEATRPRFR